MVDGDGEGSLMVVCVLGDHLGELEPPRILRRHGHTDQSLSVSGHEIDILRRGELGRADQIPLVLPVWIVCTQDQMPLPQLLQGILNGAVLKHKRFLLKSRFRLKIPV